MHTNAPHLHVQYKIPYRQAKCIILNCPICHPLHLIQNISGTNPRGLDSNHIWQMDVTYMPQFAQLYYVHVTIDTFSSMIWAMPLSGETTNHVITHIFEAFTVLGVPTIIKTDNGPTYSSTKFQ